MLRAEVDLETSPRILGDRWKYTLDGMSVQFRTPCVQIHTLGPTWVINIFSIHFSSLSPAYRFQAPPGGSLDIPKPTVKYNHSSRFLVCLEISVR